MTNVKEINGQTFDDITPEDSTETGDDDYEEDDEYDDEDSNGIGFGLEYMPALQGTVQSPCYNRDSNGIGFGLEYMPALQGTVQSFVKHTGYYMAEVCL